MTQTWMLGPLGLLLAIPATLLLMVVLVDVDPRGLGRHAASDAATSRTPTVEPVHRVADVPCLAEEESRGRAAGIGTGGPDAAG